MHLVYSSLIFGFCCGFQTLLCGRYPCIEYRPGSMGKASPGVDLQASENFWNLWCCSVCHKEQLLTITADWTKHVTVQRTRGTLLSNAQGARIAQWVEHPTEKPGAILVQVQIPGEARDFSPRVSFQCTLSYDVCAITCINISARIKNPKLWQPYHCLDMKVLHVPVGVGSTAPAAAVPYSGRATQISCKGQWSTEVTGCRWRKFSLLPILYDQVLKNIVTGIRWWKLVLCYQM